VRVRFPEAGHDNVSHGGERTVSHLSVARLSANSMSMNLRHAATLALVGWYLMIPPASTYNGEAHVDSHASVRSWTRIGRSFDSSADCEKAKEKSQKNVQDAEGRGLESAARMDANPDDQALAGYEAARHMKCVSKDDPRIKGIAIPLNPAWSRVIPAKRSAPQGKE
jgi:hypothetical protein